MSKLVSYCQGRVLGFWGLRWWPGEVECWALWGGRAAGSSARPGAWSSLHPVCPAQSLHTHINTHTGPSERNYTVTLLHHRLDIHTIPQWLSIVRSHYWVSTLTSFLLLSIFHAAGQVSDGGESAGQQWSHQSRTSLYVCRGETHQRTEIDLEDCSWTFDWIGNCIHLCRINYFKLCIMLFKSVFVYKKKTS